MDEIVRTSGYHRKYAIRILRGFQLEPQTLMTAAEVVPGAPPLEMGFKSGGELGGGPGAAGQSRQIVAQGQVYPFQATAPTSCEME